MGRKRESGLEEGPLEECVWGGGATPEKCAQMTEMLRMGHLQASSFSRP